MNSALTILTDIRKQFDNDAPLWLPDDRQVVTFNVRRDGLIDLRIYVSPDDEIFDEIQQLLSEPDIASALSGLIFEGPDEGANGTREWNFRPLLETAAAFPELRTLYIEPSAPGDHNGSIIGYCYDEEAQVAKLIARMPNLTDLTVPSAPQYDIFQLSPRLITHLRVDFGYDRLDFLANLADTCGFPNLQVVDFGVAHPRSAENPDVIAPYEEYAQLFDAPSFSGVREVTLRNSGLNDDELSRLLALRRDLQVTTIQVHAS